MSYVSPARRPVTGLAERHLSYEQLCEILGVSRTSVQRWVEAGVPSKTYGMRVRRFLLSEVEAWLLEREATL